MTEKSIKKTIQCLIKKIEEAPEYRDTIPILLTDSKGKYLEKYHTKFEKRFTNSIIWWSKGGATTLKIVKPSFDQKTKANKSYTVYVWLGTCDLTKLNTDGTIELRSRDETIVAEIIAQSEEISHFFISKACHVIFLQIPYYSIAKWNKERGQQAQQLEKKSIEEDKILIKQIDTLNSKLNTLNTGRTPIFNKDQQKSRTYVRGGRTNYNNNWSLLKDGLHPGRLLSRLWLLKIIHHHKTQI
ncbi:hypothetical protein DPMN_106430 [Dreissena polymorpha]|uniref:Uncharacterized protein n=1 Tax=Dreissena polymorpha TaxID=45954 RepID=A0A9D4QIV3_DREPO|nr:hypothetical protein DPMN_106430 [Dreissena polymorpha]